MFLQPAPLNAASVLVERIYSLLPHIFSSAKAYGKQFAKFDSSSVSLYVLLKFSAIILLTFLVSFVYSIVKPNNSENILLLNF